MIPEERLSPEIVRGQLFNPWSRQKNISEHWGPIALSDPSAGLAVQLWTLTQLNGDFLLKGTSVLQTLVFTRAGLVSEISLAFDQNGRPTVAFVEDGDSWLWWYNSLVGMQVFSEMSVEFVSGMTNPRVTLDDHRSFNLADSDIILGYIRAGNLYYRQQRDRYLVERLLKTGVSSLAHVSMNSKLRLQFVLGGAGEENWALGDVVEDLCITGGLKGSNINVSDLYNDTVYGLKVTADEGMDQPIKQLMDVFFFDKAEFDRRLHFPMRGREASLRIPYDDLVRGNPTALKLIIRDEAKLPKLVNITHIDPSGGYAKNKQTAQRRSNLVKAKGTMTIESQVVATADQMATAAMTWLKKEWAELTTYEFKTTIKYSELVPTDVIEVEDSRGTWHRMALDERNDEGQIISWVGKQDVNLGVYRAALIGNTLPPPVSTTPGLVGETELEILNLPVMRDQDDLLGIYIAATGASSAWTGYTLMVSTDGGLSYVEVFTANQASIIGLTETDLKEEISYEYQADQTLDVDVNFPLSSVSYDQVLANQNRAVVGDEIIQFQTATLLGQLGGRYQYRLSGLVRARYATTPGLWPLGTRFVLLDTTVIFVRAQQWMIGVDLAYKPVTIGATEDETIPTFYLYAEGTSQREWPVSDVHAIRDGSNNVTVTWIGAARLGFDSAPYHSAYFTGYRVKFDNGFTIDTLNQTATYSSAPVGVDVQVCALNSITGEGPYSTLLPT